MVVRWLLRALTLFHRAPLSGIGLCFLQKGGARRISNCISGARWCMLTLRACAGGNTCCGARELLQVLTRLTLEHDVQRRQVATSVWRPRRTRRAVAANQNPVKTEKSTTHQ